jgi:phosphoribosylaminoimidazole-succinocarboxamide synthase
VPVFNHDFISLITNRYIELFEKITGKSFQKQDYKEVLQRVKHNTIQAINHLI